MPRKFKQIKYGHGNQNVMNILENIVINVEKNCNMNRVTWSTWCHCCHDAFTYKIILHIFIENFSMSTTLFVWREEKRLNISLQKYTTATLCYRLTMDCITMEKDKKYLHKYFCSILISLTIMSYHIPFKRFFRFFLTVQKKNIIALIMWYQKWLALT